MPNANEDLGHVEVELKSYPEGRVAWLRLSNPRRLNAGSPALVADLKHRCEALHAEDDLRAAVLTGAGDKAFMAGADLHALAGLTHQTARDFITALHHAARAIRDLPVPVIGRLRGHCLGGGLELAAACDFRAADHSFVMGMPEVRVGLPSVIEAALLPMLVGWGRAREMVLTGIDYDAEEALAMGFVQRLVAADELDATVEDWVARILACGPVAVRSQKALLAKWERLDLDAAIAVGIDHFADAYRGDEPKRMLEPLLRGRKG